MNLIKFSKEPQYIAQLANDIRGFEQKDHRNYQRIISLTAVLSVLIAWEVIARLEIVRPIFISSPTAIFEAMILLFQNGFSKDIWVSTTEFVLGFSLAILIAIPFGLLLGWYRLLHAIFDPFVSMLYATPRIALLPILILWLGIGIKSKIAIVFLGAVFPILINVIAGMRTIDATLLKCAYAFGANDRQIFKTLAIPNSIPFIIAGLRIGVSRALVGIVVGEFVASTAGIGHMMSIAGATFQTDKVYVGIIFLAGTAYSTTWLLRRLEARFESWRPHNH